MTSAQRAKAHGLTTSTLDRGECEHCSPLWIYDEASAISRLTHEQWCPGAQTSDSRRLAFRSSLSQLCDLVSRPGGPFERGLVLLIRAAIIAVLTIVIERIHK